MSKNRKKNLKMCSQHGGAVMEYILVTTFAATISLGAFAYLKDIYKNKLSEISSSFQDKGSGLDGF